MPPHHVLVKPSKEELALRVELGREVLSRRRLPAHFSPHFGKYRKYEYIKDNRLERRPMPRKFERKFQMSRFNVLRKKYQEIYRSQFEIIERRFGVMLLNTELEHPSGGNWYPFLDKREKFDEMCLSIEMNNKISQDETYARFEDLYEQMKEYLDNFYYAALFIDVDFRLRARVEKVGLDIELPDRKDFKVDLEHRKPIVSLSPTLSFDISKQDFLFTYHKDGVLRKHVWEMSIQDQIDKRTQILKEFRTKEWEKPRKRTYPPHQVRNFYKAVQIPEPPTVGKIERKIYQKSLNVIGWKIFKYFGLDFLDPDKGSEYAQYRRRFFRRLSDLEWRSTREKMSENQYLMELEQEYKDLNDFLDVYFDNLLEHKIEVEYQKWRASMKDTIWEEGLPPGRVFVNEEEKVTIGIQTSAWVIQTCVEKYCGANPKIPSHTRRWIERKSKKTEEVFGLKPIRAMFGDLIDESLQEGTEEEEEKEEHDEPPPYSSVDQNKVKDVIVQHVAKKPDEKVATPRPIKRRRLLGPASSNHKNGKVTKREMQRMIAIHYGPQGIPDRKHAAPVNNRTPGSSSKRSRSQEPVDGPDTSKKSDDTAISQQSGGPIKPSGGFEHLLGSSELPIMIPPGDDDEPNQPPNKGLPLGPGSHYAEAASNDDDDLLSDLESRVDLAVGEEMMQSIAAANLQNTNPQNLEAQNPPPIKRKRGRPRKHPLPEILANQASPSQGPSAQPLRPSSLQENTLHRFPIADLDREAQARTHGHRGGFSSDPAPLQTGHPEGLPSGFTEPENLNPTSGTAVRFPIRVPRPRIGPRPMNANSRQDELRWRATGQKSSTQNLSERFTPVTPQPTPVNGQQSPVTPVQTGLGAIHLVNQEIVDNGASQLQPQKPKGTKESYREAQRLLELQRAQRISNSRILPMSPPAPSATAPVPSIADIVREEERNRLSSVPHGSFDLQMGGQRSMQGSRQAAPVRSSGPQNLPGQGSRGIQTPLDRDVGRIVVEQPQATSSSRSFGMAAIGTQQTLNPGTKRPRSRQDDHSPQQHPLMRGFPDTRNPAPAGTLQGMNLGTPNAALRNQHFFQSPQRQRTTNGLSAFNVPIPTGIMQNRQLGHSPQQQGAMNSYHGANIPIPTEAMQNINHSNWPSVNPSMQHPPNGLTGPPPARYVDHMAQHLPRSSQEAYNLGFSNVSQGNSQVMNRQRGQPSLHQDMLRQRSVNGFQSSSMTGAMTGAMTHRSPMPGTYPSSQGMDFTRSDSGYGSGLSPYSPPMPQAMNTQRSLSGSPLAHSSTHRGRRQQRPRSRNQQPPQGGNPLNLPNSVTSSSSDNAPSNTMQRPVEMQRQAANHQAQSNGLRSAEQLEIGSVRYAPDNMNNPTVSPAALRLDCNPSQQAPRNQVPPQIISVIQETQQGLGRDRVVQQLAPQIPPPSHHQGFPAGTETQADTSLIGVTAAQEQESLELNPEHYTEDFFANANWTNGCGFDEDGESMDGI